MVTIRRERKADVAPREALLDVSYGPIRFSKTSERLREGRRPGLSFVAASGRRLVGTVRLWDVSAGPGRPALLLGPLAVAPDCRKRGIGSALVQVALREAALRRPCRRAAGRRRALLRTVRLLEREDRGAVAARTLRAASAARLRAQCRARSTARAG